MKLRKLSTVALSVVFLFLCTTVMCDRETDIGCSSAQSCLDAANASFEKNDFNEVVVLCNKGLQYQSDIRSEFYTLRAFSMLHLSDSENAEKDFKSAIEIDSRNNKAYAGLAMLYYLQGNYSDALSRLDSAEELGFKPNNAFRFIRADSNYYTYRYIAAIREFSVIIESGAKTVPILYKRGYALYYLEKYKEANDDFDAVIKSAESAVNETNNDTGKSEIFAMSGLANIWMGNYDEAKHDLDKAVKLNAESALAYFGSGILSYHSGRNGEAIRNFESAEEHGLKSNPHLYYFRANAYYNTEEYLKAADDYTRVMRIGWKTLEVRQKRAYSCLMTKNYSNAIADYDAIVESGNAATETFVFRGVAMCGLGRMEPAFADFKKAEEDGFSSDQIHKIEGQCYILAGSFYFDAGDYEKAIEICKKALSEGYDNRDIRDRIGLSFYYLGMRHYRSRDYSTAIADFGSAIENGYQNAEIYFYRASANYYINNYSAAVDDFSKIIATGEMPLVELYNFRGLAYYHLGKFDESIGDFTMAISLNPKKPKFYHINRGNAYYMHKDYENAQKDYNRALECDKKNVYAFYNRGSLNFMNGNYAQAIADYSMAQKYKLRKASLYHNRGTAYCMAGKADSALDDFNYAITVDPGLSYAYLNRGIVRRSKGDSDNAKADLVKADEIKPGLSGTIEEGQTLCVPVLVDENVSENDENPFELPSK
jgi:tetratricopeptide (TPR) repeat protein